MRPAVLRLPILTYHRVGLPPRDSTCRGLFTSPGALEAQVRLLRRLGYGFVDFEDLAGWSGRKASLPDKPVLLTFDDGHQDNLEALPLLARHGARATVFTLAGEAGRRRVIWEEASERAPTDLLSWEQCRILRGGGWRIESHGLTHRRLGRLPADLVERELRQARETIAAELGRAPVALAFPFGDAPAAVRAAARRAGYRFACTTEVGVNDLAALESWALRRIPVKGYRLIHRARFALAAARGFA